MKLDLPIDSLLARETNWMETISCTRVSSGIFSSLLARETNWMETFFDLLWLLIGRDSLLARETNWMETLTHEVDCRSCLDPNSLLARETNWMETKVFFHDLQYFMWDFPTR